MADRSYDDPCGIARALNLIGERWALLVVRELMFGPKRFTDLKAGLPTASQNVLSHRLRELEESGVVTRRRLGPPVGASAYELTPYGHALRPVVMELARWGSHVPIDSRAHLSVSALMFALLTTFSAERAGDFAATIELRVSGEHFQATVADGKVGIIPGSADKPDAVLTTTAGALRGLVFLGHPLAGAAETAVQGDHGVARRFLGLFPRPEVFAG
jgi:DNA-binding HxlR family transcriptional regulator